MPEMRFHISWPDGRPESCYSPSLVIKDYFEPGESYELGDFLERSRRALTVASERVRARYGHPCSLALSQLSRIEAAGARYRALPDAHVRVEAFEE